MDLEQFLQYRNERRQIILDGIPHEFLINLKVDMYDTVPHGAHQIPGDCRIILLYFFGNLISHFPNDNEMGVTKIGWFQGVRLGPGGCS